jgi:hypothetical protein
VDYLITGATTPSVSSPRTTHCHTEAVIAVARKLAERTSKTLTTGQTYEIRDMEGWPLTKRAAKELIASRYTVTPQQRTKARSHTLSAKRARMTR